MAWEFERGLPIYRQLVDRIRLEIAGGTYRPGQQIPPVRELALTAGVNPNTMQKALARLEQDGLIYVQRTTGRFITEDEAVLRGLREGLSREYIETFFTKLRELGLDNSEILGAVKRYAAEQREGERDERV